MRILIFGNPLVESDNKPLKLVSELSKKFPEIEFIHADPTEDLTKFGENLIILDTVIDIKKPIFITDLNQLRNSRVLTMHDFDLAQNLLLLKKIQKIRSVLIIGIPKSAKLEEVVKMIELIKSN